MPDIKKSGSVDAGRILGFSHQALSNVVSGHAYIFLKMAVRLAKAFGVSDEHWIPLKLAYNLAEIRKRADDIQVNSFAVAPYVRTVTQQELF
jgi:addiction module HigA family antidote